MAYLSPSFSAATLVSKDQTAADFNDISIHEVIGSIISSWCPRFVARTILGVSQVPKPTPSPTAVALSVLKAHFLQLKRRLHALEAENESLKHVNKVLRSDISALDHDISELRAEYYDNICDRRKLALSGEDDRQKIQSLTSDVENAQKFIMAMVDIGLHEPVLHMAAKSTIEDRQNAEESLIDAITQAASRRDSAWSRIILSVTGPRSPDNYISALKVALKARKDLRQRDRASQYWKAVAKLDPKHAKLLTPSSSELDDLGQGTPLTKRTSPGTPVLDKLILSLNDGEELPKDEQTDSSRLEQPTKVPSFGKFEPEAVAVSPPSTDESSSTSAEGMHVEPEVVHQSLPIRSGDVIGLQESNSPSSTDSNRATTPPANQKYSGKAAISSMLSPSSSLETPSPPQTPSRSMASPSRRCGAASCISPTKNGPANPPKRSALRAIDMNHHKPATSTSTATNSTITKTAKENKETRKLPYVPVKTKAVFSSVVKSASVVISSSEKNSHKRQGLVLSSSNDNPNKLPSVNEVREGKKAKTDDQSVQEDVGDSVASALEGDSAAEAIARSSGLCLSALQSLERICALMSSSDMGSLDVTSEEEHSTSENGEEAEHHDDDVPDGGDFDDGSEGGGSETDRDDARGNQSPVGARRPESIARGNKAERAYEDDHADEAAVGSVQKSKSSCRNSAVTLLPPRPATPGVNSSLKSVSWAAAESSGSEKSFEEMSSSTSSDMTPSNSRLSQSSSTPDQVSGAGNSGPAECSGRSSVSKNLSKLPMVSGIARRIGRVHISSPKAKEEESRKLKVDSPPASGAKASRISGSERHPPAASPVRGNGANVPSPVKLPSPPSGKRLSGGSSTLPILNPSPQRSTGRLDSSSSPKHAALRPENLPIQPLSTTFSQTTASGAPSSGGNPSTPSTPKVSVGRSFLRRLSNIPGTASKTKLLEAPSAASSSRPSRTPFYLIPPPASTKPRSNTINTISPLPPTLSTPSPEKLAAASGRNLVVNHQQSTDAVASTKPRSNTVISYSPVKRSPLSQNVVTVSAGSNSDPRLKRRSGDTGHPASSPPKNVPPTTPRSRPAIGTSNIAKSPSPSIRFIKRTPSGKEHAVKKASSSSTSSQDFSSLLPPPTAAFMRPVENTPAKVSKRMTNSIKPLIPTWTPSAPSSPTQCRNIFRNSLSMVVR